MKEVTSFWMLVIAAVALSPLLSSCGSLNSSRNLTQHDPPAATAGTTSSAAADAAQAVQPARGVSTDYKISPRDILQISIFQVQDLNNTVQVNEDGTVALPLVGKVQLNGRTTSEAEQILTAKFRKYLQSPQVTVAMKTYGKRITINGEVKNARVLGDDGSTTLSQAIAEAGGFTDLADSSRIHVARAINGQVQDKIYNLEDIQAGKTNDPVLEGGDIVVAESSQVKVAMKNLSALVPFAMLGALF